MKMMTPCLSDSFIPLTGLHLVDASAVLVSPLCTGSFPVSVKKIVVQMMDTRPGLSVLVIEHPQPFGSLGDTVI